MAKRRIRVTALAKKLYNPVRVIKAIEEKRIQTIKVEPNKYVGETEMRFRHIVDFLKEQNARAIAIDCTDYANLHNLKNAQALVYPYGIWLRVFEEVEGLKRSGCRVYLKFREELRRVYWRRVN